MEQETSIKKAIITQVFGVQISYLNQQGNPYGACEIRELC